MPKIVDWYMDGKINIDDLITHTMPLDKINDAFDLMHEGKSIRCGRALLTAPVVGIRRIRTAIPRFLFNADFIRVNN